MVDAIGAKEGYNKNISVVIIKSVSKVRKIITLTANSCNNM